MQRRKIQINKIKKEVYKGKKVRSIYVKYQAIVAYFKQKEYKDRPVFTATFLPLIHDLLEQLASAQLISKLQIQSREPLKSLPSLSTTLKLEHFELKALSKQNHIQELCSCLCVEGNDKRILNIQRGKLMSFFKYLRTIYPDLSENEGQKIIIEQSQVSALYKMFVGQWNRYEEKGGRINAVERVERKLCRSLYFLGVLIENNILEAIELTERRRKEQNQDLGTKSQHKKNIKGFNQQVSTVHSFGSLNQSNVSVRLKSEPSEQENFQFRNNLSYEAEYSQYSGKSDRVISRTRQNVWDKAQIGNLSLRLTKYPTQKTEEEIQKYEINYLSNDVENILIEQAFKMQKFTDSCYRNAYNYFPVDYSAHSYYMPYSYAPVAYQGSPSQYLPTYDYPDETTELTHLKRSLNLVQTRKTDADRYQ